MRNVIIFSREKCSQFYNLKRNNESWKYVNCVKYNIVFKVNSSDAIYYYNNWNK